MIGCDRQSKLLWLSARADLKHALMFEATSSATCKSPVFPSLPFLVHHTTDSVEIERGYKDLPVRSTTVQSLAQSVFQVQDRDLKAHAILSPSASPGPKSWADC